MIKKTLRLIKITLNIRSVVKIGLLFHKTREQWELRNYADGLRYLIEAKTICDLQNIYFTAHYRLLEIVLATSVQSDIVSEKSIEEFIKFLLQKRKDKKRIHRINYILAYLNNYIEYRQLYLKDIYVLDQLKVEVKDIDLKQIPKMLMKDFPLANHPDWDKCI